MCGKKKGESFSGLASKSHNSFVWKRRYIQTCFPCVPKEPIAWEIIRQRGAVCLVFCSCRLLEEIQGLGAFSAVQLSQIPARWVSSSIIGPWRSGQWYNCLQVTPLVNGKECREKGFWVMSPKFTKSRSDPWAFVCDGFPVAHTCN